MEKYAEQVHGLGFEEKQTEAGLFYYFDPETLLRKYVECMGMVDVAKAGSGEDPMVLAVTGDWAKLTAELGHLTVGLKTTDCRCKNPNTGLNVSNFQSRDEAYIFAMMFGQDSKLAYDEGPIHDFFEFFGGDTVVCKGDPEKGIPELSNFRVVTPQDMNSHWKVIGIGGASAHYFCLNCMCHKHDKGKPTKPKSRCKMCKKHPKIRKCYCHDVTDGQHLQATREVLEEHCQKTLDDSQFTKMDEMLKKSQIEHKSTTVNKQRRPCHIDFVPNNAGEAREFNTLINDELKIRFQDRKTPEELEKLLEKPRATRTKELKKEIKIQQDTLHARKTIDRNDLARWFTADQTIPCLLHLSCRVMEKLFWTLLRTTLARYMPGDNATRKKYIAEITKCMNEEVFADKYKEYRSAWKYPYSEDDDGAAFLEPRTMTGGHARKCVEGMKAVATAAFKPELDEATLNPAKTRRENKKLEKGWHDLMDVFIPLLAALDRKEDFTDEQIDELHLLCNLFFDKYATVLSAEEVTHYIHLLGAGHITYHLTKHRNLAKYSQQGWEALNQLLKQFYFNSTNHGGCQLRQQQR